MTSVLEDKEAIRDLLSAYCFHVDDGEYDQWAELFTEDATLLAGELATCQGRAEIKAFIVVAVGGDVPARKHCTINAMIEVSGAKATSQSYIIVVRAEDGGGIVTSLAGRYQDELVKKDGEWKFQKRIICMDILGDLGLND
ncbi:MAG: nuclear transport factor 2 family protein [Porticoccaceae bacterium]|nr:nuclear transport factor 2 family protein [Porticoccaceae bacterium]